jgi:hypothetical protein
MAADGCVCIALVAPGSVEAEVGRLQARIAAGQGPVSVQALPPLVPIGFLPEAAVEGGAPAARAFLSSVERSVRAPWRVQVGSLFWQEGYLFLGIDSGGLWEQACAAAGTRAVTGFFPCAEGFFLGCGDATKAQREAIGTASLPLSFSSATIALVRLSSPHGAAAYWREVYWETIEERPLRGRRET